MKIYTKTGDTGETGLFGGARVSKASRRVDAYGQVDELNSMIGWTRVAVSDVGIDSLLNRIQNELFEVGAELGSTEDRKQKSGVPLIAEQHVHALERAIDQYEQGPPPLTTFVLPGGSEAASRFHLARCICRRAERALVALAFDESLRGELFRYLNRLSDLLFVLARYSNHAAGVSDIPWKGRQG
ncbi:MAG: cob(I)yrinic acid a,c-diamide adenosyltransferase [Myxococcales bacterium]|jgi:cob(I)alamin adenosyltransferase